MKSQQGFTLIEILLALVIVAMASFTVVMNIPMSADDSAHKYARQLFYRMQLMSEEAMLSGREFGVWINPQRDKLVLATLEESGWKPLQWSKINNQIDVEDNVVVDFSLASDLWHDDERLFSQESESLNTGLFSPSNESDEDILPTPQILLMSSGEVTPFSLRFESRASASEGWVVKADAIGDIKILSSAEADHG